MADEDGCYSRAGYRAGLSVLRQAALAAEIPFWYDSMNHSFIHYNYINMHTFIILLYMHSFIHYIYAFIALYPRSMLVMLASWLMGVVCAQERLQHDAVRRALRSDRSAARMADLHIHRLRG